MRHFCLRPLSLRHLPLRHLPLLLLLLLPAAPSCIRITIEHSTTKSSTSDQLSGRVIGVIDGDTYDLLMEGNEKRRIRMEGIDAPERGMPYYQVAKQHLSDLCYGKEVTLKSSGRDAYNRDLAYTYLPDGRELGQEMIKAGLAWHLKKYNSDTLLARLEIEARAARKGLWTLRNPMAPWTNRALHRQGISTKDSFQ